MKLKYKIVYGVLLSVIIVLMTCALVSQASDLDQYLGKTAAQLSAMVDYQTIANTAYWNSHAYAQIRAIINAMDSTVADSQNALNGIRESADYGFSIDSVVTGTINDYPCPAAYKVGAVYMHGTVFLNDTTEWIVDHTIVVDNSSEGLHIIGSPGYKLIKTSSSGADSCFSPIIDIRAEGCNVEIEGFEIDGWTAHDPDPTKYSNGYDSGIAIHGANNVRIHDMYIHNVGGSGISISRNQHRRPPDGHEYDIPQKVWIYNNKIDVPNYNFPEYEIVGGCCIGITGGKEIFIHHNYFIGGERVAGIDMEPDDTDDIVNKIMIKDNIFEGYNGSDNGAMIGLGYVGSAIAVTGYGYTKLHSVDISGNVIFNYVNDGVYLQVGGDVGGFGFANQQYKISDNFIMGCREHGIALFSVRAVQILNNDISYNGSAGILVGAGTQDVQINSNQVYRNLSNGIWVNSSSTNDASGMQIDGNYVFDNGLYYPTSSAGIKVENADRVSITNNSVYETRGKYLDKWDRYRNGANQDTDTDYNNAYSDIYGVTQCQSIVCDNVTNLKVLGNNEWGHPKKIYPYDTTNVADFTVDSTILALRTHGYLTDDYEPTYYGSPVDSLKICTVTSTKSIDGYSYQGYLVFNADKFVRDPGADSLCFIEIRDNGSVVDDTMSIHLDIQELTSFGVMDWRDGDDIYVVSRGKITTVVDTTGLHYLEVAGIQGFFAQSDGLYQFQSGLLVDDSLIVDQGLSCSFINCQMIGFNEWENKTGINPQPQEMNTHSNFQIRDPLTNIRTDITNGVIIPDMNTVLNRIYSEGTMLKLRGYRDVGLLIADSTDMTDDTKSDTILFVNRQNNKVNTITANAPLTVFSVDTTLLNTGNTFTLNMNPGAVVFDSVYNVLKYWNGTTWIQPIDSSGLGTGPVPLPVYTDGGMAAIASPQPGWTIYNSTDSLIHYYDTDSWVEIPITSPAADTVLITGIHDVTKYGAVADGGTDDKAAIDAAIAAANPGDVIYFPFVGIGQYVISGTINITIPLKLVASPGVYFVANNYRAFSAYGAVSGTSTTLSVSAQIGSQRLYVVNGTGFSAGDYVLLYSSGAVPNCRWYLDTNCRKGEWHIVNQVVGNTIWIDGGLYDNCNVATETFTLTKYNPIKVEFNGIRTFHTAGGAFGSIALSYCMDSVVEDCEIKVATNSPLTNALYGGIEVYGSYNTKINNCQISGIRRHDNGYGVLILSSYNTVVTNCYTRECRKGYSVGQSGYGGNVPSRNTAFSNCTMLGGGRGTLDGAYGYLMFKTPNSGSSWGGGICGFDVHGGAELVKIENCTITDCYLALMSRGNDVDFVNNKITGRNFSGLYLNQGKSYKITDNKYDNRTQYRTTVGTSMADSSMVHFIYFDDDVINVPSAITDSNKFNIEISNNIIQSLRWSFIYFDGVPPDTTEYCNITCRDNTVFYHNEQGGSTLRYSFFLNAQNGYISLKNCSFLDNVLNIRYTPANYWQGYSHPAVLWDNSVNSYRISSSDEDYNYDNVVDLLRVGKTGTKLTTVVEDTADGVRHFLRFYTASGDTLFVPAFLSADTSGVITW